MTREELGRVAWKASLASAIGWDSLRETIQEDYCKSAEAVRAAVIAAEFGPHASVVTTEYLTALTKAAHAADCLYTMRHAVRPEGFVDDEWQQGLDYWELELGEALAALRTYSDWQRKGEKP